MQRVAPAENYALYLGLVPDILISSGGALVKTEQGEDCEIAIDTTEAHYWNYKVDPRKLDPSWGDSIYTLLGWLLV